MTKRNQLLGLAAGVILAASAWYIATPYWALSGLRDAAMAGDKAQLEKHIDFQALRQSIKDQLRASIAGAPEKSDGPLAELGGDIAVRLADPLIETMITTDAIKSLAGLGKLVSHNGSASAVAADKHEWSIDRSGLNEFTAAPEASDGKPAPALVFRRDGFRWKLSGIDFPADPSK